MVKGFSSLERLERLWSESDSSFRTAPQLFLLTSARISKTGPRFVIGRDHPYLELYHASPRYRIQLSVRGEGLIHNTCGPKWKRRKVHLGVVEHIQIPTPLHLTVPLIFFFFYFLFFNHTLQLASF